MRGLIKFKTEFEAMIDNVPDPRYNIYERY